MFLDASTGCTVIYQRAIGNAPAFYKNCRTYKIAETVVVTDAKLSYLAAPSSHRRLVTFGARTRVIYGTQTLVHAIFLFECFLSCPEIRIGQHSIAVALRSRIFTQSGSVISGRRIRWRSLACKPQPDCRSNYQRAYAHNDPDFVPCFHVKPPGAGQGTPQRQNL